MPEDLTQEEKKLMDLVPDDGSSIGNKNLMSQLGWDGNTYWEVRNRLLAMGLLVKGRGKGGSVRRASFSVEQSAGEDEEVYPPEISREEDLYDKAITVLRDYWSKDNGLENFVVQKTARQGRRQTGTWSRPDLVVVYVPAYQFIPQKSIEVVTFEVKDYSNFSVAAVYEALAHLRSATFSHVLVRIPSDKLKLFESELEDASSEARRHGIGLIVAENIADYDTWETYVDAVRREPDPRALDEFLEEQISPENRRRINGWL